MGKPTGFMEYDRCEARSVEPKERIKNFDEFHIFLSKEKQREQAARCMDCGVPFCQSGMTVAGMTSGCPLHNLVPEWNDLLYTGNYQQAYNRLHKTIISRSLPPVYVRLCVRRHVPVDTGEIRYLSGTMSMESLRRHTKKVMPDHIFQRFVPERKLPSSVPVLPDWQQQIS